jgi:general secretion pathway protein D
MQPLSSWAKPAEPISLNFVNAEIDTVARALANLTGRSLVLDPRVKGIMTLSTEKPMSADQAWAQFLSALRLQSFAVVEVNGLFKVVPEAEAKLQGGAVIATDKATNSGQIITQIFTLQHENANQLVAVLRPLISPNNTINVNPGTNALVITDYADNLQRLGRIIASLDTSQATDVEVINLKNALAIDLAPILQRLLDTTQGAATPSAPASPGAPSVAGGEAGFKTVILPEPRSNSLILRAANPARLAQARSLAEKLDQPAGKDAAGNLHVVYLKNADAVKLANTLRAAMVADARTNSTSTGTNSALNTISSSLTPPAGSAPTTSQPGLSGGNQPLGSSNQANTTGGQIQADTATNSLIISAPEPVYRQLRMVIDQLDGRRAQVLVESLIAEVDANKASQFGVQWQNVMGNRGGNVGIIGTNFGTGGNNLLALSTQGSSGTLTPGAGMNIGTAQRLSNGTYVLSSLANFLQQNGGSNILSTPTLLTLDNEEAKIVVGQNVPFITGQYSTATVSGAVNPFQTIERKDVGLTLRVKPQISETGTVKMTIYQEVSSVVANSIGSTTGLITNKRSIESNVLVEDGQVVVLGGLLSDEYTGENDQVPGLGSLPILGNLFRSENRTRNKTNLMVFLRPVVLRDSLATEGASNERYRNMLDLQRSSHLPASGPMTVENSMTMPALPERKP